MIINDLYNNKKQGLAEGEEDMPVHRIGLTVIDPQHPMVSKRREEYQKTVRVPGHDREQAITAAINHLRRRGYKVLDHHYLGTVDEDIQQQPSHPDPWHGVDPRVERPQRPDGSVQAQSYHRAPYREPVPKRPITSFGKKNVAEVSLGDYRKKAQLSKAMAQTNRFFGRDDPATVAQADQTIAKRERGLARADTRVKPYTPPAQDAEKMQRDLTAKYPNIDELVRQAELRRDPYYDRAEGNAYYRGREAEQNYQRLRQIQRVIQGLNESLNRSHLL